MRKVFCEICGKLFESNHSQTKYCSENCIITGKRKSWNKYSEKNRLLKRLKGRINYQKNKETVNKRIDKYQKSLEGKIAQNKSRARQKLVNAKKINARDTLNKAIASGKIKKGKCEVCKSNDTQGHHENYDKPLDVTWLCIKHHVELHSKKRNDMLIEMIRAEGQEPGSVYIEDGEIKK